jgi:hypothetical protein
MLMVPTLAAAIVLVAPLAVAGPAVDFDTEVVPILTVAGCNSGACHGSAAGRGGFKLSLLGADPALDHDAIAREHEGRRLDLVHPEESLVLLKPLGRLDHGGDIRLRRGDFAEGTLRRWIEEGGRRLRSRRLERFAVEPSSPKLAAPGEVIELRAVASFSDGSEADVTRFTVFAPDDPAALDGDRQRAGRFTARRRGQSVLVARFLDRVLPVRVTVPLGDAPVEIPAWARRNEVDDRVNALLSELRLTPAPPADDAGFLRRARLALTGTLPDPDEIGAFLGDARPQKRAELIDRLLASREFTAYWTFKLAALLRVRGVAHEPEVAPAYQRWIEAQVAAAAPFDAVVRGLILARGDSHVAGAAAFHRSSPTARDQAELVSEVFLGARLRCANCHDHPLDRWTQDDYHGLAAIFARIERGRVVGLKARGEVTHPRTGEAAAARLPGERFIDAGEGALEALARWLTSAENPRFARALVNRLWKELIGRGLVEPADDLRDTNPPTHPELLDFLARDFAENGFDIRRTLRLIARSAAFERGPGDAGMPADDRYLSRSLARPLDAEVLADAIASVTGVAGRYGESPEGTRAIALADPLAPADELEVLGRCRRQGSCESAPPAAGLATRLHLVNGELLNRRLGDPAGRLAKQLDAGASDAAIVDEFYLRALGRPAAAGERAFWLGELAGAAAARARRELLEDFVWALLTSREFATNH